jgi:hypothetical protein
MAAVSDEVSTEPAEPAEPARPLLRIVSGNPTAAEVAALVAVLAASGGGGEPPAPRRTPAWSHPARLVRSTPAPGRGGWRTSGLPR